MSQRGWDSASSGPDEEEWGHMVRTRQPKPAGGGAGTKVRVRTLALPPMNATQRGLPRLAHQRSCFAFRPTSQARASKGSTEVADSQKENVGLHAVSRGVTTDDVDAPAAPAPAPPPSVANAPYDASHDIQDIDRRLSALQNFLKTAKVSR